MKIHDKEFNTASNDCYGKVFRMPALGRFCLVPLARHAKRQGSAHSESGRITKADLQERGAKGRRAFAAPRLNTRVGASRRFAMPFIVYICLLKEDGVPMAIYM